MLRFDSVKIRFIYWILDNNDPCYDLILGRKMQKEYGLYLGPDDDLFIKKNNTDPCCNNLFNTRLNKKIQ